MKILVIPHMYIKENHAIEQEKLVEKLNKCRRKSMKLRVATKFVQRICNVIIIIKLYL